MPDDVIREIIEIAGNSKGGVQALKAVSSEMDRTDKKTTSFA